MKKIFKIFLGLVVVIALFIAGVFFLTSGMADTVNAFFTEINSGNFEKAKGYLSEEFKKATSDDQLKQFLAASSLKDYASASWNSRSFSGAQGEISGTVTTKTGGTLPVKVNLVKENGEWKILYLQKVRAGLSQDPGSISMPSSEIQVALVKDTMDRISTAINTKSFNDLHSWMSKVWQEQFTVDKLETIFEPFVNQSIDLKVLNNLQPNFTTQSLIDENGILRLSGNFPTQPSKVDFKLSYVLEGEDWKVIGLNVNVG